MKYISFIKTDCYICMVILIKNTLKVFAQKHTRAARPLNLWYKIVKEADWSHFADLKESFRDADYVGNDRFVFNIKGNTFRLVAMTFFDTRTVYIRFIGTHSEYDKINCSTI